MTAAVFRRISLGLAGAVEGAHMGHPDFRAGGRVFATLHPGFAFGMVKLTPEQQQAFIRSHPGTFTPEAGAWGRSGCTRVSLAAIDEETLGHALTLAWRNSITSKVATRPKAKAAKGRVSAKAPRTAKRQLP